MISPLMTPRMLHEQPSNVTTTTAEYHPYAFSSMSMQL